MDKKIIYTNVNWFTISDYPDENLIPDEIHQAKKIWDSNGGKNTEELCNLVSNYINCNFIADNFSDWENYFDDSNYGEFIASKIKVSGVKFTDDPLPLIRAEAWIEVMIKETVTIDALDNWLDDEWGLQTGIMWGWDIANDDDLDLAMEENSGIEALWVDDIPNI